MLRALALGPGLRALGVAHLAAGAIAAIDPSVTTWATPIASAVAGAIFLAAAKRLPVTARAAWAVLFCLTVDFTIRLTVRWWMPGITLLGLTTVVYGGLLHGRRGSIAALGGTVGAILASRAVLVATGYVPDAGLDFARPDRWLIGGAAFAVHLVPATYVLQRALAQLAAERRATAKVLARAEKANLDAAGTRRQRGATEQRLADAERLHSVGRLALGVRHHTERIIDDARRHAQAIHNASPAELTQIGDALVGSVQRGADATRALLALSRAAPAERVRAPLDTLIQRIIPFISRSLPETLVVSTVLSPCPDVEVEEAALRQLLLALALNARDATDGVGALVVSTRVDSGQPVLTVADDGPGLSDAARDRAGEPGFTTRDTAEHAGLGLFTARAMAARWGAKLTLDSPATGGVLATLRFPAGPSSVAAPADAHAALTATPAPLAASAAGPAAPERIHADFRQRRHALQRTVLGVLTLVGAAVTMISAIPGAQTNTIAPYLGTVVTGALTVAWFAPISPRTHLRIACALTLGVNALGVLHSGFTQPVAVLGITLTVLLATVFDGPRAAATCAAAATAVFVAGIWGPLGADVWPPSPTDVTHPRAWLRVLALYPVTCFVAARTVLAVVDLSAAALTALHGATVDLERARITRAHERSLLRVNTTALTRLEPSEAIGRAMGQVVHDLNNAYTAMMSWGELLRGGDADDSRDEAAVAIRDAADLAANLLLDLDTGDERAVQGARCVPATELPAMLRLIEPRLPPGGALTHQLDPACALPVAGGDLRRVVMNLVVNACDALGPGGHVDVRCEAAPGAVVLTVRDTGCGMDAAVRDRVFEPFFTSKGERGTGLGLHTVATLVHDTGGTVDLWSEPGRGTTFTLRWPTLATV